MMEPPRRCRIGPPQKAARLPSGTPPVEVEVTDLNQLDEAMPPAPMSSCSTT
jgi:hypothetical protein